MTAITSCPGAIGPAAKDAVEPLKKLLETRNKLTDLLSKVDRSEDLEELPYYKPSEDSEEMAYLRKSREALGGSYPVRKTESDRPPVPSLDTFTP